MCSLVVCREQQIHSLAKKMDILSSTEARWFDESPNLWLASCKLVFSCTETKKQKKDWETGITFSLDIRTEFWDWTQGFYSK